MNCSKYLIIKKYVVLLKIGTYIMWLILIYITNSIVTNKEFYTQNSELRSLFNIIHRD